MRQKSLERKKKELSRQSWYPLVPCLCVTTHGSLLLALPSPTRARGGCRSLQREGRRNASRHARAESVLWYPCFNHLSKQKRSRPAFEGILRGFRWKTTASTAGVPYGKPLHQNRLNLLVSQVQMQSVLSCLKNLLVDALSISLNTSYTETPRILRGKKHIATS